MPHKYYCNAKRFTHSNFAQRIRAAKLNEKKACKDNSIGSDCGRSKYIACSSQLWRNLYRLFISTAKCLRIHYTQNYESVFFVTFSLSHSVRSFPCTLLVCVHFCLFTRYKPTIERASEQINMCIVYVFVFDAIINKQKYTTSSVQWIEVQSEREKKWWKKLSQCFACGVCVSIWLPKWTNDRDFVPIVMNMLCVLLPLSLPLLLSFHDFFSFHIAARVRCAAFALTKKCEWTTI